MRQGPEERCRELEAKIRVLEEENALLSERAEETLLLGLVAESISNLEDPQLILESLLERVSLLKDIPYCACLELRDDLTTQTITSYATFRDDTPARDQIILSPGLIEQLDWGSVVIHSENFEEGGLTIHLQGSGFVPRSVFLVVFVTRAIPKGVFLFADDDDNEDRLGAMQMLLHRAIDTVVAQLDNRSLIDELRLLNSELDRRVEVRTKELQEVNENLRREIVEHKQTERALRESEAKFRNIVEAIPMGMYLYQLEPGNRLVFTDFNPAAEQILGVDHSQFIGKPIEEAFPNLLQTEAPEHYRAIAETGGSWQMEQLVYRDEQIDGIFEVYAFQTSPNNMVAAFLDTTERKRLEAVAKNAEILRVELEKEKEVVALKERIISIVSHEFRTPLAVIQTSSDLLTRYFDRLEQTRRIQLLQQITEHIMQLSNLIEDVLIVSRAQAGKIEFNPSLIELESFCRNVFEKVQFTDNFRHKFEFSSNIPQKSVMVDAKLLQHILSNLLTNAVKYSPAKSTIHLELNSDADTMVFQVHDEGIGIPEEDLERLFEPFHRASNVGDVSGTGLGLSISDQYVRLHGGHIELESEVGKGSTFRIVLPMT